MSDRPIVQLDHRSEDFAENWVDRWREARQRCPVGFSEAHGGYWVLSGYDEVADVARDDVRFSSYNDIEGGGADGTGILIPQGPVRQAIIEQDPPETRELRRLIAPWFAPSAVNRLRPMIEKFTTTVIDDVIESGSCDLLFDIVGRVPAAVTLHHIGLPLEAADLYAEAFHKWMYISPFKPEFEQVLGLLGTVQGEVAAAVADRRANPRDDMVSELCRARIMDRELIDQEVQEVIMLLLGGGLDTTTSLAANALVWLDEHPAERTRLLSDERTLDLATEEFLRYFSPIQALGRTVKEDVEVGGCRFAAGDHVLIGWAGANHDPAAFENPDEVILDRFPNRHASFGLGGHRCLGSSLARAQFKEMIRGVLTRMPDYRLDRSQVQRYQDIGIANGYISLPATFTPGSRTS